VSDSQSRLSARSLTHACNRSQRIQVSTLTSMGGTPFSTSTSTTMRQQFADECVPGEESTVSQEAILGGLPAAGAEVEKSNSVRGCGGGGREQLGGRGRVFCACVQVQQTNAAPPDRICS
jgi:hypothetical protein